jgi:hypothetical protein
MKIQSFFLALALFIAGVAMIAGAFSFCGVLWCLRKVFGRGFLPRKSVFCKEYSFPEEENVFTAYL